MSEVTIPFAFPGEGMVINGALITPGTEQLGDAALHSLPSYCKLGEEPE